MLLVDENSMFFNIPSNIFSNQPTLSYNLIGNYLINSYVGPMGANSIDKEKKSALLKAYNEAIERRALMLGGHISSHSNKVPVYNLINKKIEYIPHEMSTYNLNKEYNSDTTGTAVYFNSEKAIFKAVSELLEKNHLFLFWYGNYGHYIAEAQINHSYYKAIKNKGFLIDVFMINFIKDFYTVITIVYTNQKIVSSGVSGNTSFKIALSKSIEEAYLLLWQNNYINRKSHYQNVSNSKYTTLTNELKAFLNKKRKKTLDTISLEESHNNGDNDIEYLISNLPHWIKTMYICLLQDDNHKAVLAFSKELYNSLPQKNNLYLNKEINKQITNVKEYELDNIPNCMIV